MNYIINYVSTVSYTFYNVAFDKVLIFFENVIDLYLLSQDYNIWKHSARGNN